MNKCFAIILTFLGIILLGQGITGYVVSETCCIGPTCLEENVCILEGSDSPGLKAAVGLFLVVLSLGYGLRPGIVKLSDKERIRHLNFGRQILATSHTKSPYSTVP